MAHMLILDAKKIIGLAFLLVLQRGPHDRRYRDQDSLQTDLLRYHFIINLLLTYCFCFTPPCNRSSKMSKQAIQK